MRKAIDPLIGSWRLDVSKSSYWALMQTTVKELSAVYRELSDGMVEVSIAGMRADGSTISDKAVFPRQGGFVKDQQGIASKDISSIVTVIDPYTFYLGKGCALDIPLKNSGIWKPEVRSQKPE